MTDENKCGICGKTFKTPQALAGHLQGPCGTANPETGISPVKETKTLAKTGSLDAAIEKLQVPTVPAEYNGYAQVYWEGFNRGVNYGATTILVGIRSAQELSSLGISQATPIIKMAQEMRQAEGQAAQELASQVGQMNIQGNQQILAALNNLAAPKAGAPNPMQQVMADTMKPVLQQIMQKAMGGLLGGFKGMPAAAGQTPALPGQDNSPQGQAPGAADPNSGQVNQETNRLQDSLGTLPENIAIINEEEDIDV